jgi:hypothetical protein
MTELSGASKICVICGKDVSQQKRVKDSRGRYYCQRCCEQRMTAQRKPAASPVAAGPTSAVPAVPHAVVAVTVESNVPGRSGLGSRARIGILGAAVAVIAIGGVAISTMLHRSLAGKTIAITMQDPSGLEASWYIDSNMNCRIHLPRDWSPESTMVSENGQSLSWMFARHPDAAVGVVACRHDGSFDDFIRKTRSDIVKGEKSLLQDRIQGTIEDEAVTTLGGLSGYEITINFSQGTASWHGEMVLLDGPNGTAYVVLGMAHQQSWSKYQPLLESSMSTFQLIDTSNELALIGELSTASYDERVGVMQILAARKTSGAATAIAARLNSPDDRYVAGDALKKMGNVAEAPVCAVLAASTDKETQAEACHVLKEIGTNVCLPQLNTLTRNPAGIVSNPAKEAMAEIRKRNR